LERQAELAGMPQGSSALSAEDQLSVSHPSRQGPLDPCSKNPLSSLRRLFHRRRFSVKFSLELADLYSFAP
jgi:hypothetical protein